MPHPASIIFLVAKSSHFSAFWLISSATSLPCEAPSLLFLAWALIIFGSKWCQSEMQPGLEVLSSCLGLLLVVYFGQIPRFWLLYPHRNTIPTELRGMAWMTLYNAVFFLMGWEKPVVHIVILRYINILNDIYAFFPLSLILMIVKFKSFCMLGKPYPIEIHYRASISNLP